MRYYNENPQVTHWMGKCAMLQQELDMLREKLEKSAFNYDILGRLYIYENRNHIYLCERFEELKKELNSFNSLPWYKKIFYNFKL